MNTLPKVLEDIVETMKTEIEDYEEKLAFYKEYSLLLEPKKEDKYAAERKNGETILLNIKPEHNKQSILFFILLKEYVYNNDIGYDRNNPASYYAMNDVCRMLKQKIKNIPEEEYSFIHEVENIELDMWERDVITGLVDPDDFEAQEYIAGCCGDDCVEEAYYDILENGVMDYEYEIDY